MKNTIATRFERSPNFSEEYVLGMCFPLEAQIYRALASGPLCMSQIAARVSGSMALSSIGDALESMITHGFVQRRVGVVRCHAAQAALSDSPLAQKVLAALKAAGVPITSDQLAADIPVDRDELLTTLAELINAGAVRCAVKAGSVAYRQSEQYE